ncbi:MAG: ketosteroid isomerase-related protein [Hyphomicrobiaceae bacterium]
MSQSQSELRQQTASLIRDYYAAFNAGDHDTMLNLMVEDVIHDVNQGERRIGREKFRAFNARMAHHYKESLSDISVMVNKDGTRAAAEFNVDGTYLESEPGLPPAKRQNYVLPAGAFFQLRDGKIERVTTYYNLTEWITQVAG